MKKFMFIAAAACVTLASCVKNEPTVSVGGGDELIAFDTPVVAAATKAGVSEVPDTYDENLQFGVFGCFSGSPTWGETIAEDGFLNLYMNNIGISYVTGDTPVWKNTNTSYYWPKDGWLYFFAYSPYKNDLASVDAAGLNFTDYVVPSDASQQEDLLYTGICTNAKPKVMVEFKHALSAINFVVKKGETNAPIVLKSMEIYGLKDKADFSTNLTLSDDEVTWLVKPEWTNHELSGEGITTYMPYYDEEGVGYTLTAEGKYVHNLEGEDAGDKASFILLPQDIASAHIDVRYTLDGLAQYAQVFFDEGAEWEPGKRYTYTLTFTAEEIIFEPSVDDWSDVELDKSELLEE